MSSGIKIVQVRKRNTEEVDVLEQFLDKIAFAIAFKIVTCNDKND